MSINRRLGQMRERLDRLTPNRLIVLTRMPDGTEREMTAPEYVEAMRDGADMIRVVRGDDLRDVDLILSTFKSVIC